MAQTSQCDNWRVELKTDTSRCPRSGKIEVSLVGPSVTSLQNITYSLSPDAGTTGGTTIVSTSLPLLTNISPGYYTVAVTATCNGNKVIKTAVTNIIGTYPAFYPSFTATKPTYGDCHNGEILLKLQGGRPPYTVKFLQSPAGFDASPMTLQNNDDKYFNNLPAGSYQVSVVDACGTSQYLNPVTVEQDDIPNYLQLDMSPLEDCSGLKIRTIGQLYLENIGDVRHYSIWVDDELLVADKLIGNRVYLIDTLTFPTGKSMKDYYGKVVTVKVTSSCLPEATANIVVTPARLAYNLMKNCADTTYNLNYTVYYGHSCFPLKAVLYDGTGAIQSQSVLGRDTIYDQRTGVFTGVRTGNYRLVLYDSDGAVLTENMLTLNEILPPTVTMRVVYSAGEIYQGRSNVASVFITVNGRPGNFPSNGKIEMLFPYQGEYPLRLLQQESAIYGTPNYHSSYLMQDREPLTPGFYMFRTTIDCDTFLFPITITEQQVGQFTWTATTKWECGGLRVFPKFTGRAPFSTASMSFQTLGRWGTSLGVVALTNSFLLPVGGTYKVALGSLSPALDWGENVLTFETYTYPLAVDSVLGWICPGSPANSGVIRIRAKGGGMPGSAYTYQLANKGEALSDHYLATNQTGDFSSGAGYTLDKGMEYSIKITDSCNNFIVQDVKIYDFATHHFIISEPYYCAHDFVQLMLDLPVTNPVYTWAGPRDPRTNRYYESHNRFAIIPDFSPLNAGIYTVSVKTDMCPTPIRDTTEIKIAPIVTACYSAVTDTVVNPYAIGLLGNWKPLRTMLYYDNRKETSTEQATNIRTDGTYKSFMSFWAQDGDFWSKSGNLDTTKWVWNEQSTAFNSKGLQLETMNAMGIYSAALFGYDNSLQIAAIANGKYRSSAYDGFEDYDYVGGNCDVVKCATGRHFDFTSYASQIDDAEHHTGRYSLRVEKDRPVMLKVPVVTQDVLPDGPDFQMQSDDCASDMVLKGVRLNGSVLLPTFSPVVGTNMLFSAWVKEAGPCTSTSYANHRITIFVGGAVRQTIELKPTGGIIDGWQRYEQAFNLPVGDSSLTLMLEATTSTKVYFDDIRFHPYNANMKSYVYSSSDLRMMADLDENNYATFYEYDDDGTLIRVKKETERGILTIKETRNGIIQNEK
ncbi:hypothetical protein CLV59_109255 [Chitinophaga dinghuensis]|uniref:Uncharacterized protein n=2 Tax=Chitinophaga dinghuensis TaxID=1539050 RepID=A0A327VWT2_9BACT|nr:hypothetical protein CLV59_109255 [Chitinophaga dinghuensis]